MTLEIEMTEYSSFAQWYAEGKMAPCVRTIKSPGSVLDILESVQPAGNVGHPSVPELVLVQTLVPGSRVNGDIGWGRFNVVAEKGQFFLAAPDFANTVVVDGSHVVRGLSFPVAQWQTVFEEAANGRLSLED
jgi:AraC family transcriptional regulator